MLITLYGFYWKDRRLGGNFKKYIQHFQKHENFTSEQWLTYQTQELRKLLIHAFETVPYYRELYSLHGFTLESLSKFTLEDLKLLPFLLFFAFLGILMTCCLFWVGQGQWQIAAFLYVMGAVGFSGANNFYDALLTNVASKKNMG